MAIYKLGEICSYVEGYVNPPINENKYFAGNAMNWMKVKDLIHGEVINSTELTLSKLGLATMKNKNQIFKKGSIVWSKSGSVGNCAILGIDTCANRGVLNIIPNDKKVLNKYLYYHLFKNKHYFSSLSTGAVLQHFYGPNLMNTSIELPSISEQQKIIDIIKPIEELHSKFSNFTYALMKTISFMQPTSNKVPLSKLVDLTKTPQQGDLQLSAKVMKKRNCLINEFETPGTYSSNMFSVEKGQLLINTIRPYLEKFAIAPIKIDATGTLIHLKIKKSESSVIRMLMNDDFWDYCNQMAHGTKMPVIKKTDLMNYNVELLPVDINGLFTTLATANNILLVLSKIKKSLISILIK